jgi:large subunit ribosomal protein L31
MGLVISSLAQRVTFSYVPRSLASHREAATAKMKADIHPEYHQTDIVCACGAVYHTRSTRRDIRIGICAACHPFFTGEQKFVDTAGRVEKFARRYGSTKAARAAKKA